MDHHRILKLEKIQMQVVAVAALLVGYFLLAPALRTWDTDGPITFVPLGGYYRLLLFAGAVCLIAAVAGLLTVKVRPQGALLAVLIGAGGVSLHSLQIRSLLWMRYDSMPRLFLDLAVETFLLLVLMILIEQIVGFSRRIVRKFRPGWLWSSPVGVDAGAENLSDSDANFLFDLFTSSPGGKGCRENDKRLARPMLVQCGLCLAVTIIVAGILLLCLARSAERGQILFALVTSFFLAQLLAHWLFPVPYSAVAWISPMLVGIACFCIASATLADGRAQAWADVPMIARALPIDWMTAGGSGALLGFWISSRVREMKYVEKRKN